MQALVELARELPPDTLNALANAVEARVGLGNIDRFVTTQTRKEKLRRLEELCKAHTQIDGPALAFALRTAGVATVAVEAERYLEIAWTGPGTGAVPLRRVDQVIYDLVESAQQEVLLVTYAAYKADKALRVLSDATTRGVALKLIIELAQASGGKISFDGLQAFRAALPKAQIYYWPLDRRKRNSSSGNYGSMHAKCVIADRSRAIVSSANMTDYALETNMELGLLVGRNVASALAEHFDRLIVCRELILAP